ncbi:MAG TPA: hypothetical protein VFN97_28340 [Actinospica sp.]|nr:hypothetical protein [Actinospica sp.]
MSTDTNETYTDQEPEPEPRGHEWPNYEASDAQREHEEHEEPGAGEETAAGASTQPYPNPYVTSAPYPPADEATEPGAQPEPGAESEPDGVPLPENLGGRNTDLGGEPLVDAEEYLSRWTAIQMSFLEDPGAAVDSADALVREATAAIVAALEERSDTLASEAQAATDTEQRRLALRQYRAYLGTLLPR